jgi:hypothetical protein
LKQVLILAGIHGNETSGVNYLVQFIQGLAQRSGSSPACDMDIIPIVNPWGYVHNLPFNRNGVDVGRDFSDFDSHEARVARRFLREKRYDLVLDLREDPEADGFCIWQYGLDDAGAAGRTVSQVQTAGYPIAHDTSLMFLKPRNGIVAAPLWGLTFLRLSRQLTIAGYIRRNVSNVVFTVVAPAGLPLEDRIAMQRMAVETFLDQYGEGPYEGGLHAVPIAVLLPRPFSRRLDSAGAPRLDCRRFRIGRRRALLRAVGIRPGLFAHPLRRSRRQIQSGCHPDHPQHGPGAFSHGQIRRLSRFRRTSAEKAP